MARTARDKILEAIAADKQQTRYFQITWPTTTAHKHYHSFQKGPVPGAGTYAGSLARTQLTSSTTGALGFTNPDSPDKRFLTYGNCLSGTASHIGVLHVLDLLVSYGGFDTNNGSPQSTTGGAGAGASDLPRYDGDDVQILLDVDSAGALGATPRNLVVTYTNSALASAHTTQSTAITAGAVNGEVPCAPIFLPLQAGDKGVVSIQSADLDGTMGTAGRSFCMLLVKRLAAINVSTTSTGTLFGEVSWVNDQLRFKRILDNACLSFVWSTGTGATTPVSSGTLEAVAVDLTS